MLSQNTAICGPEFDKTQRKDRTQSHENQLAFQGQDRSYTRTLLWMSGYDDHTTFSTKLLISDSQNSLL